MPDRHAASLDAPASPVRPPQSRIDDIRAWRDQTEGIYGLPHHPSDPPMMCNNKGWWKDVDALLMEMDRVED